jgi:hypothetical protein
MLFEVAAECWTGHKSKKNGEAMPVNTTLNTLDYPFLIGQKRCGATGATANR